jgi:hypothetical protein
MYIIIKVREIGPNNLPSKACFKRRASHVPNALKTIANQLKCLIIYCR